MDEDITVWDIDLAMPIVRVGNRYDAHETVLERGMDALELSFGTAWFRSRSCSARRFAAATIRLISCLRNTASRLPNARLRKSDNVSKKCVILTPHAKADGHQKLLNLRKAILTF